MSDIVDVLVALNGSVAGIEHKVGEMIQQAGQECEAEAKLMAPVDTGALRESITYSKESDLAAIVSTDIPYAIFQEFGTIKMAPQPYLIPAFEIATSHLIGELQNL